MFLIVGLGNPGAKYASNRHNIGFMAADEIHRRHGFSPSRAKFQGEIADGSIEGVKSLLLKPNTFMNESGRAVREAIQFYKIPLENIVVIYDELDLAPGKVKLKNGGGSGGHNGIKSLDAHIGKDYRRVRLGIGHPGDKAKVSNYVLGDFAKADQAWLEPLLDAVARNVGELAKGEDTAFTNKLALRLNSDEPQSARGQTNKTAKHEKTPQSTKQDKSANTGPMADMLKKLFGGKE